MVNVQFHRNIIVFMMSVIISAYSFSQESSFRKMFNDKSCRGSEVSLMFSGTGCGFYNQKNDADYNNYYKSKYGKTNFADFAFGSDLTISYRINKAISVDAGISLSILSANNGYNRNSVPVHIGTTVRFKELKRYMLYSSLDLGYSVISDDNNRYVIAPAFGLEFPRKYAGIFLELRGECYLNVFYVPMLAFGFKIF